jgi:molybdenum cofactor cytidylyltransferase
MRRMVRISAILLGAGESKRMGLDKLSLPWGEETIFEHCLNTFLRSKVKELIVVLGGKTKGTTGPSRRRKAKLVMNPHYKMGMSTSIRRGIQAIDPECQGILIALGDQPFLKIRTINALIQAFAREEKGIVVPSFRGRKGHPVIFHKRYQKDLLKLQGDVGGKSIIERYPEDVRIVHVKSEGVVKDIDTWKDYSFHPPFPRLIGGQAQGGREGRRGKI